MNYTTLGYGDVTPVERWRLLGPMTAMNGVLLFGWSTAVIFEVRLGTATKIGPSRSPWRTRIAVLYCYFPEGTASACQGLLVVDVV